MNGDEEERKLVERLQARASAMRKEPIELMLGNQPGPYITPQCIRVGLQNTEDMTGLRLETDKGHVVLVPTTDEALLSLLDLGQHFIRPDAAPN
jgi:hypothetical protein